MNTCTITRALARFTSKVHADNLRKLYYNVRADATATGREVARQSEALDQAVETHRKAIELRGITRLAVITELESLGHQKVRE